ncbi:hypothetical protein PRIPAC_90511 [Pristionchus pacificus]|uniref:Uncharacterized protein n=1 Tax=Pristionchus pacificus TaxID=54126 RepID=A0A2A6B9F5_PRIPA|nr:hypothetical protein PRIPAC_90511 [Pristionchus pacificus]|eukprot:PDM62509.1 hypothetical protein PRIPAC_51951 [Pristionchus pacificus]
MSPPPTNLVLCCLFYRRHLINEHARMNALSIHRAVTLDGKRITLDNDQGNIMSFNPAKNAWNFYYGNQMSVWIIAASCTIVGRTNARTETNGACDNAAFKLRAHHASFPDNASTERGNYNPATMNIRCRAGLWVFQHLVDSSTQEGWSIKNATCYP